MDDSAQIDIDDVGPVLERECVDFAADSDAGVVEQEVDASTGAYGLGDGGLERGGIADVERHRVCVRARAAQTLGHVFGGLDLPVRDPHVGTRGGKRFRQGGSDS